MRQLMHENFVWQMMRRVPRRDSNRIAKRRRRIDDIAHGDPNGLIRERIAEDLASEVRFAERELPRATGEGLAMNRGIELECRKSGRRNPRGKRRCANSLRFTRIAHNLKPPNIVRDRCTTCLNEPPAARPAWGRSHGILAQAYNRLGDHTRAAATCRRVTERFTHTDFEYVHLNLIVQTEEIIAQAGLGYLHDARLRLARLHEVLGANLRFEKVLDRLTHRKCHRSATLPVGRLSHMSTYTCHASGRAHRALRWTCARISRAGADRRC